eukprot:354172-Chlamydomonas_euryale.AAC.2
MHVATRATSACMCTIASSFWPSSVQIWTLTPLLSCGRACVRTCLRDHLHDYGCMCGCKCGNSSTHTPPLLHAVGVGGLTVCLPHSPCLPCRACPACQPAFPCLRACLPDLPFPGCLPAFPCLPACLPFPACLPSPAFVSARQRGSSRWQRWHRGDSRTLLLLPLLWFFRAL